MISHLRFDEIRCCCCRCRRLGLRWVQGVQTIRIHRIRCIGRAFTRLWCFSISPHIWFRVGDGFQLFGLAYGNSRVRKGT